MELAKGTPLVLDVDQDRAGRDDVHRTVLDRGEVLRRRANERRAVRQTTSLGEGAGVLEQRLRDVAEDHGSRGRHEVRGGESDESVAGAHIENGFARADLRPGQQSIPDGNQVGHIGPVVVGLAAVPTVQHPSRPAIVVGAQRPPPGSSLSREPLGGGRPEARGPPTTIANLD
jgi:hypothetical protein